MIGVGVGDGVGVNVGDAVGVGVMVAVLVEVEVIGMGVAVAVLVTPAIAADLVGREKRMIIPVRIIPNPAMGKAMRKGNVCDGKTSMGL